MRDLFIAVLVGFLASLPAFAEKHPRPGPVDSRQKTVVYSPRDVVKVLGHYGYQTMIEFADYEEIENISIGDSIAWQVVPNERGNKLFIKPVEQNAQTNLTVVTSMPSAARATGVDSRVYVFSLDARAKDRHNNPNFTFRVQFQYPQDEAQFLLLEQRKRSLADSATIGDPADGMPSDWNFNYTFAGNRKQVPVKIFDNGRFTYFQFDDVTDTPAIFLVDGDKNEALVNGVRQGRYVVVHRVARQFTLRNGKVVTCVFNEEFTGEPALDQGSPVERSEYRGEEGRIVQQRASAGDR